ncbi:MAG: trypsin-like peptidase domain-containing protein [Polaribacter sp.]|nr:trypsin-like peptidase domain-containing protein [Polaribacter sp.]
MKKILGILGVAVIGGGIALGGYKLFVEQPQVIIERTISPLSNVVKSNYTETGLYNGATTTDFTIAAEKTVNAVVHVKNTAVKTQINPWAEFYYGRGSGARKYEQVGTGSGVVITSDGYVITNNHVIAEATDLEITLNNQKKYKAELIGTDPDNDIALLKINTDQELPYIPFGNSDQIKVGEWVLAVGNPYNLTSTVTAGIISAKGRDLKGNNNVESFIQTDAAVNPGNSGGALVNIRGELIGINTAISSKTGSFIGYSFAVPSNIAKRVIEDLMEFGSVQEVAMGILYSSKENESINGVKVSNIVEDGSADEAGIEKGDVIKKINQVKISKYADLAGQLRAKRPGDFVNVTVDRAGVLLVKNVRLKKRKSTFISKAFKWELINLTKKELKDKGISAGVQIYAAGDDYSENSLRGFVITKVNGEKINDAKSVAETLDALGRDRRYKIIIEMLNLDGEIERIRFR